MFLANFCLFVLLCNYYIFNALKQQHLLHIRPTGRFPRPNAGPCKSFEALCFIVLEHYCTSKGWCIQRQAQKLPWWRHNFCPPPYWRECPPKALDTSSSTH
ncbi:hypothetical protein CY35_13G031900 [Sphagnum magellanicum]|nr:hypothetical protein CY35_13G031900 [Sphagnum magellanicum]